MKRNWKEERQEAIRVVKRVAASRGQDPVNHTGRDALRLLEYLCTRYQRHPCRRWLLESPPGQVGIFLREWESWRATEVLRQATLREQRQVEAERSRAVALLAEDDVVLVADYEPGALCRDWER